MNNDYRPFRAGDTVRHKNTGQEWVLACDERTGRVFPAGWPAGESRADACELVTAASDRERLMMLLDSASTTKVHDDFGIRQGVAHEQLMAEALPAPLVEALARSARAASETRAAHEKMRSALDALTITLAKERIEALS